jgi:hypothetical protein
MPNPYVVISGMGPGGLASAFEVAKQGRQVLLLSDRTDNFLRMQRVFLNLESRDYLLQMLFENQSPMLNSLSELDKSFLEELHTSTTLGLKDIERFIKRRLDALPGNLVQYRYETVLSSLEMETGNFSCEALKPATSKGASENEPLTFDFFIGADGPNHHAANILNKNKQTPLLTYHAQASPKQLNHGSFYVLLEREDGERLVLPKKPLSGLLVEQEEGEEMIGVLSFDLTSYIKNKGKKVKCCFTGELPTPLMDFFQETSDQKEKAEVAMGYLRSILTFHFLKEKIEPYKLKVSLVPPSKKHGLAKDKLKFTLFHTTLMEANQAALKINKQHFILVGDAYRGSNYQLGYGVNDALQHAQLVGLLVSKEITAADYTKKCQAFSEESTVKTNLLNSLSSHKRAGLIKELEDQAEKSCQEFRDKRRTLV